MTWIFGFLGALVPIFVEYRNCQDVTTLPAGWALQIARPLGEVVWSEEIAARLPPFWGGEPARQGREPLKTPSVNWGRPSGPQAPPMEGGPQRQRGTRASHRGARSTRERPLTTRSTSRPPDYVHDAPLGRGRLYPRVLPMFRGGFAFCAHIIRVVGGRIG